MPSEPLTIDRKDFLMERKPSSSEPGEIVPVRWGDSPTTPSSHCNGYGSPLSCRWGGGRGPSDFRRPLTGHGTSSELGPRASVFSGIQRDTKEENSRETSASPNNNPNHQSDLVNNDKNNDNGVSTKLDWKSLKWVRSGFSHLSSCKVIGVETNDNIAACLQSPSGDGSNCVTPRTPDEANSRKKPRLGWGEGLAKYEKKKVDPEDIIIDKENGSLDGVSKSPSLNGNSETASPTTSCSFACSLSPGLEEKTTLMTTTIDNNINTCNSSVASRNLHGSPFSLENFDLNEGFSFNLNLLLDELLQTNDVSVQGSGFAMDKLHVWKADISRKLEITETEIDTLEHELKSDNKSNAILEEKVSVLVSSREDKSYDSILDSNKDVSKTTSDELSKLLPNTNLCASVSKAPVESDIKKKVEMRKRFLKFKERVTTLKFRALQYSWKENLQISSIKSGAKSHKKFESSSHRAFNHSRLSSSGGNLSLVPTKEVVEYANMLLLDSRVKNFRNVAKMPTFILDKKERMGSIFISNNGLVENPKEMEKERSIINFWTKEDKDTFMDKYSSFGKNFKKIASFFHHKTVADCVEFYYKNHKSDLFKKTKKKPDFAKGKVSNTHNTYLVTSGKRQTRETGPVRPIGPSSLDMLGAASEMAAADVLAGICGSISSEALGSCVTSSVDHQKVNGCSKREETCSDDSCGEEINSSIWTDEEKSSFVKAVRLYGKDFSMISRFMGTRSSDQCKLFFSKARKCLGLDEIEIEADLGAVSEATTGGSGGGSGGGSDQDDTCMVDSGSGSGSGISHAEAADADVDGSPENTCSDSASGGKVVGNVLDLNADSETLNDDFTTADLFPKRDDVSSRLTFRKSQNEPISELKLDESLLLPNDGFEKPSRSGDVKLFGKIITAKPSDEKTSYGFWDGNMIRTGFSSLPDSAVLLAKYPAAFGNNLTVVNDNNRGQSCYVDKLLQQPIGGVRNGDVADPVAVIRMHYAKTEQYKTNV